MMFSKNVKNVLVLLGLSFVFLMLGNHIIDLTNPDEVFYIGTAKEMAQQKTWMVPYLFGQPQFEKPVLSYWLFRLGFLIFGDTNFGARFFPALFGMAGVLLVYGLTLVAYKDPRKAFISALVLMSSGLYIGLSRTVFTDMFVSIFIFGAVAAFYWAYVSKKRRDIGIILFFSLSALAVLTKGPLGILMPGLAVLLFLTIRKDLKFLFCPSTVWGIILFLAIALPWYVYIYKIFGQTFIQEFFYNDHIRRILEAEHRGNDHWYFYPMSMALCLFPWSLFVVASLGLLLKKLWRRDPQPVYLFLVCWMAGVLAVTQGAHSKLVSYIFPLFPALAILAGDFISGKIKKPGRLFPALATVSWLVLFALPVGLIVAGRKYPGYLPSRAFVWEFLAVDLLFLSGLGVLLFRRKFLQFICFFSAALLVLLAFTFIASKSFDDYVASKDAAEYLLKNHSIDNRILCSKMLVRGIRFYTGKDVAVIEMKGKVFWSPHPVPFLSSDEKLRAFLKEQGTTYAVCNKSNLRELRRIAATDGFKFEELKVIGEDHIVRIQTR